MCICLQQQLSFPFQVITQLIFESGYLLHVNAKHIKIFPGT